MPCNKSTFINSYFLGLNGGTNPIVEIFSKTTGNQREVSRSLFCFSLSSLENKINLGEFSLTSNSVSANLRLFNVFSEEIPPQNVTYDFHTLSENFDEGFGYDASTTGIVNWEYRKNNIPWSISGGSFSSTPFASISLIEPQDDFKVNIKNVVKDWLTGENCGIIVKLADNYESYTGTLSSSNFYIKKLFGRFTNTILYPFIEILWDDKFVDDINFLYYGSTGNVYFYNRFKGKYSDIDGTNDFPGFLSLSGTGVDSSQTGSASSLSSIFISNINGQRIDTGIYKFVIPTISYTAGLLNYTQAVWTITSSLSAVRSKISKQIRINSNLDNNAIDFATDFIIAISNFKSEVTKGDILKYNLFVKRKSVPLETLTASSTSIDSFIVTNGYFKLVDERTGVDTIPWQDLSYNDTMNFFQIDTSFLDSDRPYRFVFKFIENENIHIFDYPEYFYSFYLKQ